MLAPAKAGAFGMFRRQTQGDSAPLESCQLSCVPTAKKEGGSSERVDPIESCQTAMLSERFGRILGFYLGWRFFAGPEQLQIGDIASRQGHEVNQVAVGLQLNTA